MQRACPHVWFRGPTDTAARVLEELAAVALALGEPDHCADLLATARQARQRDGKPLSPAGRVEVDLLQTKVGHRHGRALTTPDVVTLMRSWAPTRGDP
jgi:hypothetical protein